MKNMLSALRQSLDQLIAGIRAATAGRPTLPPIFLNGYDYPIPDNRGFEFGLIHAGPWLAPAMDRHGVDPDMALRTGIAKILIDRLSEDVLKPLSQATAGVVHIDSRGILPRDSYRDYWANELHPTNYGFERIFEQAWLPELAERGIAKRKAS